MKLRSHLIVVISAAILPVLVFATVTVVVLARQQPASVMEGFVETARALALALDRDVTSVIVALRALGSSEQLTAGDFQAFHRQATRVAHTDPQWLAIVLVDPAGRPVLDTTRPHGRPLPTWSGQAFVREALDSGAPSIPGVITTAGGTDRRHVAVAVPLVEAQRVRYVIAASLDAGGLSRLFVQQRVPLEWTAAVLDRRKTIIARNRAAEQFVGRPATPDLAAQSNRAPEGIYLATNREDEWVYAAFRRSVLTGWTVALGVPAAVVDASLHRSLWTVGRGGAAFLLLGVALAVVLGRRITRGIGAVAEAATRLGHGEAKRPARASAVAEVDDLAREIAAAGDVIRARTEALAASEERYRHIVETAGEGIWILDGDGRTTFVNARMAEMLGCAPDEIVGQRLRAFVDEEEARAADAALERRRQGLAERREVRLRRKDGRDVWAIVSASPLHDAAGRYAGVLGMFTEVTDRRRAEEELRESHDLLQAILDGTEDAVFLKDRDGRYVVVNPAGCRALGHPHDEIIGKDDFALLPPEVARQIRRHDEQVMETGETIRFELRLGVGAAPRVFLSTKSPRRDPGGAVVGVIGVSRDLTERQAAEREREALLVRERGARAEAEALAGIAKELAQSLDPAVIGQRVADTVCGLLDGSVGVLYAIDPGTGDLTAMSMAGPTAARLGSSYRLPAGSGLVGLAVLERRTLVTADLLTDPRIWYPADERDRIARASHRAACAVPLLVRDQVIGALGIGAPPGRVFEASALRVLEGFGVLAALAVANARRFGDEQRQRAEAEAANRAKDEFLAMLGHELRNPLGAIVSAASVLTRPGAPRDPAASRAGDIVTRQAQHLARLVDDLLDVSRLESGKVALQRQLLDLRDVVDAAVGAIRAGAGARHRLVFEGVPAPVEADPTRLEQIALNLLDNAVKYTPPTGRVSVSVERAAGQAVLRVRDTGRGIARELLPVIFDAFTQAAPSLDRRTGGLGLGLTVVKRLVELHGGTIAADSPGPGGGSEFVVRLPLARDEAGPGPRATEPLSMPRPRHVVVIEDNADARDSLRLLLEAMGHRVETADDGRAGVEMLLRAKPDIAFVDVGLPGLDGYAVATAVRAEPAGRDLYLVALTGYGQAADREQALAAGFDAHVVKPADERALVRLLASAARPA